ncbi:MAG: FtsW/RodA/SpoVE family cell cycle protein, partial [Saccharospirillum sp.]
MTAQANALPLLSGRLAVAYQPLWQPDRMLLGTSMALLLIGLVMIGSASIDVSEQTFGVPHHFVLRHFIYMVLGFGLAYLVSAVPMRLWQSFSWLLLVLAMVLLVLVLIPGIGREVKGSWRWIDLGPIGFQPSELGKVAMILYVASYLVRRRDEVINRLSGFVKPLLVMSIMVVLLLLEPDFGTVVVVIGTILGMLFLGGVKAGQFFLAV